MGKYFFFQNIIKATFLFFCLYVQIYCNSLTKKNIYNETFLKHYAAFSSELKKNFRLLQIKLIQYNIILKMKYYEIKTNYESIAKLILLLEKLMPENNWN